MSGPKWASASRASSARSTATRAAELGSSAASSSSALFHGASGPKKRPQGGPLSDAGSTAVSSRVPSAERSSTATGSDEQLDTAPSARPLSGTRTVPSPPTSALADARAPPTRTTTDTGAGLAGPTSRTANAPLASACVRSYGGAPSLRAPLPPSGVLDRYGGRLSPPQAATAAESATQARTEVRPSCRFALKLAVMLGAEGRAQGSRAVRSQLDGVPRAASSPISR